MDQCCYMEFALCILHPGGEHVVEKLSQFCMVGTYQSY